ncbi:MAG: diacylglycerol kinase (ATP) [Saprospiraceae bacterium]|jgi:diacylglycerol kinase (ATP)
MSEKKKIVFIINPFSGTSPKVSAPELIAKRIDSSKYNHSIAFTEYAGHAISLSKEAVENGADIVVAVGGDGSVNEVAQSLVGTNACLGLLPGGSGNGFAMHLGLGRNQEKAIEYLNTGKEIWIDTCKVNDRFFANVAGIGFDARIAFMTKKNKKRGFLPYFSTSIKESNKFKPASLKIKLDDRLIEGEYAAAVVANASMYGYHFTIAPEASLQDGIMNIMLIKKSPLYKYFLTSYRFLNRSLHLSKITETYQGKELTISLNEKDYLHVDGEGYESELELVFKINPKSLKVMVPVVQEVNWQL